MTEPQLDAVEVIRRIETYEPHLVARVIAEMQLEGALARLGAPLASHGQAIVAAEAAD